MKLEDFSSERSRPQEPVSTGVSADQIAEQVLCLSFDEQRDVLRALVPRLLPRLEDAERADFLQALRTVPDGDGRLDAPRFEGTPKDKDALMEDILRQSVGGQKEIAHLVATRVARDLRGVGREPFVREIEELVQRAERGSDLPPVH